VIAALVTGATCNDPMNDFPKVNFLEGPPKKVAGLKGHTDQLQLLRSLAPRWLRWLKMIMKESSINLER